MRVRGRSMAGRGANEMGFEEGKSTGVRAAILRFGT